MRVETIRERGSGTWVVGLARAQLERFGKVLCTLASADLQQLQVQK